MRILIFLFAVSTLFADEQIQIGDEVLTVEVARTTAAKAKGLMGRKELPEGRGMLFVFGRPRRLVFWMKNTNIPLSIAFFNGDRQLINKLDMEPAYAPPYRLYWSSGPAVYALEVPKGWYEKHRIGKGAKFSFLNQPDGVKSQESGSRLHAN